MEDCDDTSGGQHERAQVTRPIQLLRIGLWLIQAIFRAQCDQCPEAYAELITTGPFDQSEAHVTAVILISTCWPLA